jgi:hypothetical protein
MATQPAPEQANFVFQGTVQQLKATTMPEEVPATSRTAVVRVDRIIRSPEALSDYAGRDITVEMVPSAKVTQSQVLIFHTNGWVFGEGLAVRAIRQEPATATGVAALAAHPDDPVRTLQTRDLDAQAQAADLIVSGRVAAIRLLEGEAEARATLSTAPTGGTRRISEHDPLWQEAVVQVDAVHKGTHPSKQVVVRFPSSTDVRWYHAPKFRAGQEGVFLLHKEQLAPGTGAATAEAVSVPALGAGEYTALSQSDVQPLDELPNILRATGTPPGQ